MCSTPYVSDGGVLGVCGHVWGYVGSSGWHGKHALTVRHALHGTAQCMFFDHYPANVVATPFVSLWMVAGVGYLFVLFLVRIAVPVACAACGRPPT